MNRYRYKDKYRALWSCLAIALGLLLALFFVQKDVHASENTESVVVTTTDATAQDSTEQSEDENNSTDDAEQRVIRIAYDGVVTDEDADDVYEHYQKLIDYTGWKVEYVYDDLSSILEKLKTGEVDIYVDASYVDERTDYILYSQQIIERSYYLIALSSNDAMKSVDDVVGKKVGVIDKSFSQEYFTSYVEENAIDCEVVTYKNEEEIYMALSLGDVDAIFTLPETMRGYSDYLEVKRVGSALVTRPAYFGISAQHPELLEDVNHAIDMILASDPEYFQNIYDSFINRIAFQNDLELSEPSQEWLETHDTLRVGYTGYIRPYAYLDNSTGELAGIYRDVIEEICEARELDVEFIRYKSVDKMYQALRESEVDCILPRMSYDAMVDQNTFATTDPIINVTLRMIYRADSNLKEPVVAYSKEGVVNQQQILAEYPDAIFAEFSSIDDCLDAVFNHRADMVLIPGAYYVIDSQENPNKYTGLQALETDAAYSLCMGVQSGNAGLLDLLNRSIDALDSGFVQNSLLENSKTNTAMTVRTIIQHHPVAFAFSLMVVALIIASFFLIYFEQRRKARRELEAANRDHLTGIPTRAYGQQLVDRQLQKNEGKLSFYALIDFDDFRKVNEKLGHQRGDEILATFAQELGSLAGKGSITCRISGDEFVIFFYPADEEQGRAIVENILDRAKMYLKGETQAAYVAASIGVVPVTDEKVSFERLYIMANVALAYAKRHGKDCITYYENGMTDEDMDEEVLADFMNALERDHIKVYYQPVIRTKTDELCGVEALARWIDPERGMILPNDFIPVLERKHKVSMLDLRMIQKVCEEMRFRLDVNGVVVPVSFNLSRYDFTTCDVYSEVEKIVEEYRIPRQYLKVEITESVMIENPRVVEEAVNKFHAAGYEVWMDDFGSGYSSLNVLKDFEFDEIKLDMGFLSTFDEKSRRVLRSVHTMIHGLGLHSIAEGVETEAQYEFLKEIGCEKVQGYLFGKPMPIMSVIEEMEKAGRGIEKITEE